MNDTASGAAEPSVSPASDQPQEANARGERIRRRRRGKPRPPDSVNSSNRPTETRAASPAPPPEGWDSKGIRERIDTALGADRSFLWRQFHRIEDSLRRGESADRNAASFLGKLDHSVERRAKRIANRPTPQLVLDLPIHARRTEFLELLAAHRVLIVCGETGSGKSTQLPLYCLEAGRGIDGLIGHTQPRRIAARSVAARIAEEVRRPLGTDVGFKVRFQDASSQDTYIKLMTDGILLAETQHDPRLRQYDTLIIDEAHERSLNIDFLLGYLKRLTDQRPDLRVIVTSATIDAVRFSEHFARNGQPAPILEVSGRSYPVDIQYRPLQNDEDDSEPNLMQSIAGSVAEAMSHGPGDILVFLPTERDIHEASKTLRSYEQHGVATLMPLYARLSTAEQQKVFQPSGVRRIVLSTNVAESSLTVPGIRYVIDTGTVRLSRYSPRSKIQRLPIEPASQASLNQRAGRCGRIGPGICYRLLSEEDFASRDRFTPPEILRTNLAQVILRTEALRLGRISEFPFLEPPRADAIRDGYQTLFELGAVDSDQRLTDLGKRLSTLPTDPRISRLIFAADAEGSLADVLIIAAALETQDPRERPVERQGAADEAHAKFQDADSDFMSLLKLWDFYHDLKHKLSNSQLRKACQQNFLSWMRMREWIDVHRELSELVRTHGLKPGPRSGKYDEIHRALLAGFLSGVAIKQEPGDYLVAGGQRANLWPGSGLAAKKPRWIMASEFVETTRKFLRVAARIEPDWIEPLAKHLVTRSYSDASWNAESRTVVGSEKVSLMGLMVVPRRRVRYGLVDPKEARTVFIRQGLVAGDYPSPPTFLEHNLLLRLEVESLQARLRQASYLASEDDQAAFYESHLPPEVYDGRQLELMLAKDKTGLDAKLWMKEADLLIEAVPDDWRQRFPDQLVVAGKARKLDYTLDPGKPEDGVTITVPQADLSQFRMQDLGWLVPGLLEEKVITLLRNLPKELRRDLAPIPDTGRELLSLLKHGGAPLGEQLSDLIRSKYGVRTLSTMFDEALLPLHLRMQVRVVDRTGETVAQSRNWDEIREKVSTAASEQFANVDVERWNRTGITTWDFGGLPEKIAVHQGGLTLDAFPALRDQGTSVSLHLAETAARAERMTRRGLLRLVMLYVGKQLRTQINHLPLIGRWELSSKALPQPLPLREHLTELLGRRAILEGKPIPRSGQAFQQLIDTGFEQVGLSVTEIIRLMTAIFDGTAELRLRISRIAPLHAAARQDLEVQMAALFMPGFLVHTPWQWLAQYPRYLKAMLVRIERLAGGGNRDRERMAAIQPWIGRFDQRRREVQKLKLDDAELETFRWMIEEYRVASFAQELGTLVPVSDKRLEKQFLSIVP